MDDEKRHREGCASVQIPKNASLNFNGNGWQCDRGFFRSGEGCASVQIPQNASLNFNGNGWQCVRGYKRSGDQCEIMTAAELAAYDLRQQQLLAAALACGNSYNYDVSGYGDSGSVSGNVDACSNDRDVSGTITLEDGREVSFDGEWVGNGEIEGYDEDGNYVSLEVD